MEWTKLSKLWNKGNISCTLVDSRDSFVCWILALATNRTNLVLSATLYRLYRKVSNIAKQCQMQTAKSSFSNVKQILFQIMRSYSFRNACSRAYSFNMYESLNKPIILYCIEVAKVGTSKTLIKLRIIELFHLHGSRGCIHWMVTVGKTFYFRLMSVHSRINKADKINTIGIRKIFELGWNAHCTVTI